MSTSCHHAIKLWEETLDREEIFGIWEEFFEISITLVVEKKYENDRDGCLRNISSVGQRWRGGGVSEIFDSGLSCSYLRVETNDFLVTSQSRPRLSKQLALYIGNILSLVLKELMFFIMLAAWSFSFWRPIEGLVGSSHISS